ncbi:MAG: LysE family translocator [Gammaproteobacteria bacterium]
MSMELYLAFVAATVVLILVPGPNVALIVANSLEHGARYGLVCVAGTSTTQAVQLTFVVFGFATIMAAMGAAFEWIRWIGVAYLVFLGIQSLRAPPDRLDKPAVSGKSIRITFAEGLVVSATNPKVLLFYGAFFPQFVDADKPVVEQLALLAVTFWVIATLLDSGWALAADRLRPVLAGAGRWRHRASGGILLTAAAVLAAARRTT